MTPVRFVLAIGFVCATTVSAIQPVEPRAEARGLPWCGVGMLRMAIGGQNGGAGSVFTTVVLRNTGRFSCVLRGYPGISLVDWRGRQIGRAATRVPGAIRWIALRPGGAASTVVHTLNPGVGTTSCLPPSAALRVYPPEAFTSLWAPVRLSECLGVLEVRPLVAGTMGM